MRVLVTGASGQLGAYVLRSLRASGHDVIAWSGRSTGALEGATLEPVDLADEAQTRAAYARARPEVVVHTAAMSAIGECLAQPQRAAQVNAVATCLLAELAAAGGARLIYTSTDLVFDGETSPCSETTAPRPLSVYGATKLAAEPAVLGLGGMVLRISLMFGPSLIGRPTFFDQQLAAMREGRPFRLFDDEWRTPLDLHTAAECVRRSVERFASGLFHLGGSERLSRLELGQRIAAAAGFDPSKLEAGSRLDVPGPEPRPRDTALDSRRWLATFGDIARPTIEAALASFLRTT